MERTIADLIKDISNETQDLVRSEIRLAKVELGEQLEAIKKISKTGLPAVALLFYALGLLLIACVFALELVLPGWLSALLVAVAAAIIAGFLLGVAYRNAKVLKRGPERTVDTVKENVQWAKAQLR